MISYAPLWETMEKRGATTYTLQCKGGISSSTIRRLKANESVSTNTLDALCKILDCTLADIVTYLPDKEKRGMEGNSIPRFWNRFALKAKGGEHIRTFFGWSFPLRRCADWRA